MRTICGIILSCALLVVLCIGSLAIADDAKSGLTDSEKGEGFVALFDGKSLDGWQGAVTGYVVEDGKLVCLKEKGGNLYTDKEYGDFVLRFDFKLTPGANNGLGI